ncbi:MAG: hypothetical protein V4458_06070 [Pseudomonadota bacterium]
MGVPSFGQNSTEGFAVSSAPIFDNARDYALSLQRIERSKGLTVEKARQQIARDLRESYCTVDNIIRQRVKRTDEKIRDKLQALLVSKLKAQIKALNRELEKAQRTDGLLAAEHVREVEAYLAKAAKLLNGNA